MYVSGTYLAMQPCKFACSSENQLQIRKSFRNGCISTSSVSPGGQNRWTEEKTARPPAEWPATGDEKPTLVSYELSKWCMAPSRHSGYSLLQWLDVFKQTEYLTWKQVLYEVSHFLVLRQAIKIISSWVTSRSHLQHKHNPADALDYQTILTWPVVHQLPFRAQRDTETLGHRTRVSYTYKRHDISNTYIFSIKKCFSYVV